jgi:DNA polymerase elongation subunit (family B)
MSGRSRVCLEEWGKMKEGCGRPVEKNLTSSAYGDNAYFYHDTPGMVSVDLLQIYRKELKMESYTLDNMCRTYLDNMTKIDLKPHEIFRKQREEAPDGRTAIATYCIRDVELPLRLAKKLNNLNNLLEFAKATCVPIDFLLVRGQQIRCLSLIARKARSMGYLIDDTQQHGGGAGGEDDTPFVGATVLEPAVGAYMDDIVTVLDFASLYPSIMMAHSLCPTTMVVDPSYDHVDGVEYKRVEIAPEHVVAFAQTPDYAVIPSLLADLKQYRKDAKKLMARAAEAGDAFAESLYNSKQLSFKVSMNSVYGFFGVSKGLLTGLKAISSSVCAIGRSMIYTTKSMVEAKGHRVVYGDSVAEYTPITVKYQNQVEIMTFGDVSTMVSWMPRDDGKDVATLPGLEIWSDTGWTSVDVIIRHRHTEDLVRVATQTGVVDVTQHHSLLRPNGEMVRPGDVAVGDDLMHVHGPDRDGMTGGGVSLAIRNMTAVPYDGYVYDVSTGNHHFAAGVGDPMIVVHNTDSVLCVLHLGDEKRRELAAHFAAAEALAAEITTVFKAPNELEFEKCYSPYLIYSKKRYTGLCYTSLSKPPKQDTKGLTLVRRDNAALVRRISTAVLHCLLYERSFDKALACAQSNIIEVLEDRVPWEEFIVSKSLRRDYKNPGALPHVVVAEKRRQRGNPCEYGSRVPYVYCLDATNQDLITSKRAECPEYAREHGLQLDKLYYIRQQIINPISTLLSVQWTDAETKIMCHPTIQEHIMALTSQEVNMIREAKRVRTNTKNKQREITSFFTS